MGKWIKTDGTEVEVAPKDTKTWCYSLKELQDMVNGSIEIVRLTKELIMVVNEEGAVNDLPINDKATAYACTFDVNSQFAFGNALVCRKGEVK